jgi:hypothetical protein
MKMTVINGLRAFELMSDAKILASRNNELVEAIEIIDPAGKPEWTSEVERLKTEQEFQHLFATIPKPEFDEYVEVAQAREKKK